MRIIAGAAGGRRLVGPKGEATRPMTDRVKESLFAILGATVHNARVLDLFAGTGSLGLEALSRGAASAVFVERNRAALAALAVNMEAVDLGGEIAARDVAGWLAGADGDFGLVFVDPPYDAPPDEVDAVLASLERVAAAGAIVVVHRRKGQPAPSPPARLASLSERRYGGAVLWLYEMTSATGDPNGD